MTTFEGARTTKGHCGSDVRHFVSGRWRRLQRAMTLVGRIYGDAHAMLVMWKAFWHFIPCHFVRSYLCPQICEELEYIPDILLRHSLFRVSAEDGLGIKGVEADVLLQQLQHGRIGTAGKAGDTSRGNEMELTEQT